MTPPPSPIDQRRLCDGAKALDISAQEAATPDDVRSQLDDARSQLAVVRERLAALQSLDDLGPEVIAKAYRDEQESWRRYEALSVRLWQIEGKEQELWRRYEALSARLRQIEGKEASS